MSFFKSVGLAGDDKKEFSEGIARIYERTIEFGSDVVVVSNIGMMRMVEGRKNDAAIAAGGVGAFVGLAVFGSGAHFAGALLVLAGLGFSIWHLRREAKRYLSIGTCDGRTTILVSRDVKFLNRIREVLRDKIDTGSKAKGDINFNSCSLSGPVTFGDHSPAQARAEEPVEA